MLRTIVLQNVCDIYAVVIYAMQPVQGVFTSPLVLRHAHVEKKKTLK